MILYVCSRVHRWARTGMCFFSIPEHMLIITSNDQLHAKYKMSFDFFSLRNCYISSFCVCSFYMFLLLSSCFVICFLLFRAIFTIKIFVRLLIAVFEIRLCLTFSDRWLFVFKNFFFCIHRVFFMRTFFQISLFQIGFFGFFLFFFPNTQKGFLFAHFLYLLCSLSDNYIILQGSAGMMHKFMYFHTSVSYFLFCPYLFFIHMYVKYLPYY